ncbi:hypothetical protein B9J90_06960 [Vibrio sp. V09_P4A23P171]|nr:hypothetical protein B9J90_06960 [Vibrio sp. V09_P4A23P171]
MNIPINKWLASTFKRYSKSIAHIALLCLILAFKVVSLFSMFKHICLILTKFSALSSALFRQASSPNSVSSVQCIDSTNQCEHVAFNTSLAFKSFELIYYLTLTSDSFTTASSCLTETTIYATNPLNMGMFMIFPAHTMKYNDDTLYPAEKLELNVLE